MATDVVGSLSSHKPEGWTIVAEEVTGWDPVALLIDTDAYAGQFYHELCAACTGQIGDRTTDHARSLAREYDGPWLGRYHANLVEDGMMNYPDGVRLQCVDFIVTPGSGGLYNSVRVSLFRAPTPEEFAGIQRRALVFAARGYELEAHLDPKPFKILGFRFVRTCKVTQTFTPEATP